MKNILTSILLTLTLLTDIKAQTTSFEWVQSIGGSGTDVGRVMVNDDTGNLYIIGQFQDTVDFDLGPGTAELVSVGGSDIYVLKLDASGDFVWAKSMGSANYDFAKSIAVDASGNVYVTGSFEGTADFDPGPGTTNLSSNGNEDVFVAKLDANGDLVWVNSMGSTSDDVPFCMTLDGSGNVYIAGKYKGTVDFDPGVGSLNSTAAGDFDAFVQKLDANGALVWAKSVGGVDEDEIYGIVVDASGNVYLAGYFESTGDFDPGAGTSNLTSAGSFDVFVEKLDVNGDLVWAKSFGGTGLAITYGMSMDVSGNLYIAGAYGGTADFDPGGGTANETAQGSSDAYLLKLDGNGDFVWVNSIGGTDTQYGHGVTTDDSSNVYLVGIFMGTVDFDPGIATFNMTSAGNFDAYYAKFDANGSFLWANSIGDSGYDNANGILTDDAGNTFITGSYSGTVDFDPGTGNSNSTSNGSYDAYILKLGVTPVVSIYSPLAGEVVVFPNPSNGTIHIELGDLKNTSIKVFGMHGQLIHHAQPIQGRTYQFELDAPAGIYIVQLSNSEGLLFSKRLVLD